MAKLQLNNIRFQAWDYPFGQNRGSGCGQGITINRLALLTLIIGQTLLAQAGRAQPPKESGALELSPELPVQDSEITDSEINMAGEVAANPPAQIVPITGLQPATTLEEWRAQIEEALVSITAIRVEATETGLQVAVEADGGLTTPTQSVIGNALVLEIPNATLSEPFQDFEPADGIALVQASALAGDTVQVVITGSDGPPTVATSATATGLVLGVTPGIVQDSSDDEAIQVVVTGEEDDYVEPNASTATRTDTPLRDTPQSIQVIPQEVLSDQGVIGLNDALRNVSGVVTTGNDPRGQNFAVRGFAFAPVLRDGLRSINSSDSSNVADLANVERIEVLKGPASILAGNVRPGGAINLISERPLSEPVYEVSLRVGNRNLIEPSLDFTGPITADSSLSYRVNALVRREDYLRDFETPVTRSFIAPMLSWQISENTDLLIELEYRDETRPYETGIPSIDGGEPNIPFDRALIYRDLEATVESTRLGYQFEHRFNDNWKIRNTSYYNRVDTFTFINNAEQFGLNFFDPTTGTITLVPGTFEQPSSTVAIQTNVIGEFSTGPIEHTLLAGVDFYQQRDLGAKISSALQLITFPGVGTFPVPTIVDTLDIFDPDYDSLTDFDPDTFLLTTTLEDKTENWGFYVQDQIKLLDNLILLAGLRFDTVYQEQTTEVPIIPGFSSESSSTSEAFTPRFGLVYQPIEAISLYSSYSTSFIPNTGVTFVGDLLDPEEGEQIEVGVRAEILDGNLVANLAFFDIDRTNVAITDALNPGFLVGEGSENIRGIELDVVGEILPGWNVVANYAYLDSEITESDDAAAIGNRQRNIPEHNFNLWSNYTVQSGSLEGLSIGLGGNFVSERFADEVNTITLDSYFLTNAAIAYERDNWRAALNFRNLFDVEYIEGSVSEGLVLFPGTGFTVIGSFSATF
ncbi:MAG: TonB-dependent siderophore receptor [Cyanobacteria bacterium J06639_14]